MCVDKDHCNFFNNVKGLHAIIFTFLYSCYLLSIITKFDNNQKTNQSQRGDNTRPIRFIKVDKNCTN